MSDVQRKIVHDLNVLGVRPGDVVMVHSSLKSLGHVEGGPETVVAAFLELLGPAGTLLMPGLSYQSVTREQNTFDVNNTPVCVGAIPEHFRKRPGTLRSVHPTHSVCGVGPLAERLLGYQHTDTTPCGPNSPWRGLPSVRGKIVMLGCGLKPNTSMHAVEEFAGITQFLSEPAQYRVILADGRQGTMSVRRHNFAGFVQRYDKLTLLLGPPCLRIGEVLKARVHLIDAPAMWEMAAGALQKNPLFFVDKQGETIQ